MAALEGFAAWAAEFDIADAPDDVVRTGAVGADPTPVGWTVTER